MTLGLCVYCHLPLAYGLGEEAGVYRVDPAWPQRPGRYFCLKSPDAQHHLTRRERPTMPTRERPEPGTKGAGLPRDLHVVVTDLDGEPLRGWHVVIVATGDPEHDADHAIFAAGVQAGFAKPEDMARANELLQDAIEADAARFREEGEPP